MQKDKILSDEDRKFVASIIGEDTMKKLETQASARGKVLEDAGVQYKTAEEPPLFESAVLLTLKAMHEASEKQKTESLTMVQQAVSALQSDDDRLGNMETKLERISQELLKLTTPGAASKSDSSIVPEDDPMANFLDKKNKGEDGKKSKTGSILEQVASMMGDETDYSKKE